MKKAIWAGLASVLISTSAMAANAPCPSGVTNAVLAQKLQAAVTKAGGHFGLGLNMWATVVAPDGRVCAVANSSGNAIQGQWLASRVISAQKAFTAATLSLGVLPLKLALSTANLYTPVQPGGSLYGLQFSNPVAPGNAYGDRINSAGLNAGPTDTAQYGTANDPMVGQVIGGINVFGGGLALYATGGQKVGGVGVSGDTSCTDHVIAWNLRHGLGLDYLKGNITGVAKLYAGDDDHPDNIVFDIVPNNNNALSSTSNTVGPYTTPSGWGHPTCFGGYTAAQAEAWVKDNANLDPVQ
jgi:uncharacterized protein GlcG (DUF336 family)